MLIRILKMFLISLIVVPVVAVAASINPTKEKWTYIRIVDYDDLWGPVGPSLDDAIAHLPQQSAPGVNFVLLASGYMSNQSAYAYTLSSTSAKPNTSKVLKIPRVAMNDPATYRRFFDWVSENFPAENYVLSFWGHGGGPLFPGGALGYAASFGGTGLTFQQFAELNNYLTVRTQKKTAVVFLCTCLNGTVENAYELKDSAEYFVAGETVVGCLLEPFDILSKQQDISAYQLAKQTVAEFDTKTTTGDVIYSAIRLSEMPNLANRVKDFGHALKNFTDKDFKNKKIILNAATKADNMDLSATTYSLFGNYLDLFDFADKVKVSGDNDIVIAAEKLQQTLKNDVVIQLSSFHRQGQNMYLNSQGLSIVHPTEVRPSPNLSEYQKQTFGQITGWTDYIKTMIFNP